MWKAGCCGHGIGRIKLRDGHDKGIGQLACDADRLDIRKLRHHVARNAAARDGEQVVALRDARRGYDLLRSIVAAADDLDRADAEEDDHAAKEKEIMTV